MSDDRFTMTREQRIDWLRDNIEWHDLARKSDAEDDLATILDLLHKGKTDDVLDYKDQMVRSYVQWRIDSE